MGWLSWLWLCKSWWCYGDDDGDGDVYDDKDVNSGGDDWKEMVMMMVTAVTL